MPEKIVFGVRGWLSADRYLDGEYPPRHRYALLRAPLPHLVMHLCGSIDFSDGCQSVKGVVEGRLSH
jgi:hypothetical protein